MSGSSSSRPSPRRWRVGSGRTSLTETMEGRPDVGLDSYDRLFPNQDTLPQGGFGNLIALPLQKGPRERGHSVFLDERFVPWADQWAFLAASARSDESHGRTRRSRGRASGTDSRRSVCRLKRTVTMNRGPCHHLVDRREPPITGELPSTLELVLGNQIYVAKDGLHPGLRNRLLRLAAFQNPEFYKAQSMRAVDLRQAARHRLRRGSRPSHQSSTGLSRRDAPARSKTSAFALLFATNATPVDPLDVTFQGELRPEQRGRGRRGPRTRHRRAGRHHRVRQDGRGRVADRQARRQYARARPSAPAARSMGGSPFDIPRRPCQVDWANRMAVETRRPGYWMSR